MYVSARLIFVDVRGDSTRATDLTLCIFPYAKQPHRLEGPPQLARVLIST